MTDVSNSNRFQGGGGGEGKKGGKVRVLKAWVDLLGSAAHRET